MLLFIILLLDIASARSTGLFSDENIDDYKLLPQLSVNNQVIERNLALSPEEITSKEEKEPVTKPPLLCRSLNPYRDAVSHPDTDISCQQGYPGWNQNGCICEYLPGPLDDKGCRIHFFTFCYRVGEKLVKSSPGEENKENEAEQSLDAESAFEFVESEEENSSEKINKDD